MAVKHTVGGLKEILEHPVALGLRERFGGRLRPAEERVGSRAGGVFLDLFHHRRDQVEGLMYRWKLAQELHHAVIILECVKARPRQLVFAGKQVLIDRLVHVPDEAEIDLGHQRDREKKLRVGTGGSVRRMARHRISLSSSSSFKSASAKSSWAERAAVAEVPGFLSSKGLCGFTES